MSEADDKAKAQAEYDQQQHQTQAAPAPAAGVQPSPPDPNSIDARVGRLEQALAQVCQIDLTNPAAAQQQLSQALATLRGQ